MSVQNASRELYAALHHRAYFGDITIILPKDWPPTCLPTHHHNSSSNTILPSSGESSDVTITAEHPIHRNAIWTEQTAGCGVQGKQIYASYRAFSEPRAGRSFVQQWAKYRYGVFDEMGFSGDPIYPKCTDVDEDLRETGYV